jgi:Chalcone isomerase like
MDTPPADDNDRVVRREQSISGFKAIFPRQKLARGEALTILKRGGSLRLFGKEGEMGRVDNEDLAKALFSAYLVGPKVVSPALFSALDRRVQEIASQKPGVNL